jgi:hypothetical protein
MRMIRVSLVLALGAGAVACATSGNRETHSHGESLAERAEAYWNRRVAKDLAGAWAFYCDAYKNRVPQSEFLRLTRLARFDLRDARVAEVAGDASRAQVTIAIRFVLPVLSPGPVEFRARESWALDSDGRWCKEDEPAPLPFPRTSPPDVEKR